MAALASVRHLHLDISSQLTAVGWAALTRLQWLSIECADQQLPAELECSLGSFTELRHLELACLNHDLAGISSLRHLTCIKLSDCARLSSLPDVGGLLQLQELLLHSCASLSRLPDSISSLSSLEHLHLSRYGPSQSASCHGLTRSDMWRCRSGIQQLPDTLGMPALQGLALHGCTRLQHLPPTCLPSLTSLTMLDLGR